MATQRLAYPPDFSTEELALWREVAPYTMTSPERIIGLAQAVRTVVDNAIPGCIVECGVWRGGSMMAVARTLLNAGESSRDLFLFDTFAGMPKPQERDRSYQGRAADSLMRTAWCESPEEEVYKNLARTNYPANRIRMVKGRVEETLPGEAPSTIALLRLDTDWYESTLHELQHLYPCLSPGGVLIIDDYGHWAGAKEAVDTFFAGLRPRPMLTRLDYTARCCVKP
jgi:hypothetical protein